MRRFKTEYPGVFYREADRIGGKGKEKVYYVVFKKDGKVLEEKVGRQYADDMTPAKAVRVRSDRIEGRRNSRKELREQERAKKEAIKQKVWTLSALWDEYEAQRADCKGRRIEKGLFRKYLNPTLGANQPHEIIKLDVDRIRINLLKTLKPQTVKHIMALLKRLVNFGVKRQLCQGLGFKVDMPRVDNNKTEDLTSNQLKNLMDEIDKSVDIEAANIMRMALFTGMRRGELFKLKWEDIDFDRGFIDIRHDPKGGKSQKIPLNDQTRAVLNNHPRMAEYVFVTKTSKPFVDICRRVNRIKRAAGIPDDFRALHGLRHVYASVLASSGQVDMYTLQKLLTHKSPLMTQRYAHLRDETLRQASTLAGNIIEKVSTMKDQDKGQTIEA